MTKEANSGRTGDISGITPQADNLVGLSALMNEDPRVTKVRGIVHGLRQNKLDLEARYALVGKNAIKGGGKDQEKIRLAQLRDDLLTDLLGEALTTLEEPIPGIEFSIDRDPLRPVRNIKIYVELDEQDYSYSVPIVGAGRDLEMQALVEKAVAVADSKPEEAYLWDKDNIVKKGTEEQRADFIVNTTRYLDFLDRRKQEGNPPEVQEAVNKVWDTLVIGRLIHMNVLDRVPTELGYNVTVSLSEKKDRRGLQVIVVMPQHRVSRRESNVRTYKILFNSERDSTLSDIVAMARDLITQNSGKIRAAQPPATT